MLCDDVENGRERPAEDFIQGSDAPPTLVSVYSLIGTHIVILSLKYFSLSHRAVLISVEFRTSPDVQVEREGGTTFG